jgi:hypothetical protein
MSKKPIPGLENVLLTEDIAEVSRLRTLEARYLIVQHRKDYTMLVGFQTEDNQKLLGYFSEGFEGVGQGERVRPESRLVATGGLLVSRFNGTGAMHFQVCGFESLDSRYKMENVLKLVFPEGNYS